MSAYVPPPLPTHTQVFAALVPEEAVDDRNVVVEVSAGVGGQEAMLFCQEVFNMYLSYAQHRGWTEEIIDYETTEIGKLQIFPPIVTLGAKLIQ